VTSDSSEAGRAAEAAARRSYGSGALEAARDAYRNAIGLERDPAVRHFLQMRAARPITGFRENAP